MRRICRIMIAAILLTGCASVRKREAVVVAERAQQEVINARRATEVSDGDARLEGDDTKPSSHEESIQLTGFQSSAELDVKIDEPSSPAGDLQSAAPGK